uniref:Endonuclease/exonuclease/phosphatase family protein n=1 Tax=Triticum urartu TaxID=4572 RepID=A0A8R7V6N2_TRIUA
NAFGVGSNGLSGGLVLFWNNDSVVSLESYNNSHIDVSIQNENLGEEKWRFTGFYGEPVRARRKNSWELMRYLRQKSNLPWLCAGDFNEVLDASEQFGGNVRE